METDQNDVGTETVAEAATINVVAKSDVPAQVHGIPPKPTMTANLELIGPEEAINYLRLNTRNRNEKGKSQSEYVEEMKSGHWLSTHQGIAIGWDNVLIDGQNRLKAIIKAKVFIWMWVFRNVDPTVIDVIDTGSKRTKKDYLDIQKVKDSGRHSSGVSGYLIMKNSKDGTLGWDWSAKVYAREINAEYFEHQSIFNQIDELSQTWTRHKKLLLPSKVYSIFAYLHLVKKHDFNLIKKFFDELFEIDGYSKGRNKIRIRNSSPALDPLRDLLDEELREKKNTQGKIKQAYVIQTWNAFVKGRELKQLRYNPASYPQYI